jgi:hypothetical protein
MLLSIILFAKMTTDYYCHLFINVIEYNALTYPRNRIMCLAALSHKIYDILPVKLCQILKSVFVK